MSEIIVVTSEPAPVVALEVRKTRCAFSIKCHPTLTSEWKVFPNSLWRFDVMKLIDLVLLHVAGLTAV